MARHEYRVRVEERRFYTSDRKGNDVLCKGTDLTWHDENPIREDHRARCQLSAGEDCRWMGVTVTMPKNATAAKHYLLLATLAAEIQEWLTLTNRHQDIHVVFHTWLEGYATLDVVFMSTSEHERSDFACFWDNKVIEYNGRSSIRYNKPEQAEQQEAA